MGRSYKYLKNSTFEGTGTSSAEQQQYSGQCLEHFFRKKMRLLVVFAFVTTTIAAPRAGLPSFEISGYSSRSAIPDMKVTFENGVTDNLVLEPYSSGPCNFIGRLANHPS